jgi:hypothetical protein
VAPEKCHVILFLIKKIKKCIFGESKNHEKCSCYQMVYIQQLLFWIYVYFFIFFEILSFAWSMTVAYLRNSHYELSNIIIMFKCKLK